ncbi:hypothetical protein AOA81_05630 [Methanomassiliicoccales archaeon RumEn M2]|nr:hypothetical protein AOA81_05630 [Methanomassiliicoccales archaeon RumEn M2]
MELSGNMGGTSPEEAVSLFSGAVSETASGCARAGGTIGHIKANLRSSGEMVSASSTTEDGNVRLRYGLESAVEDYSIVMNAIVYCLEYRGYEGDRREGLLRTPCGYLRMEQRRSVQRSQMR